ncbi:hypothetical protein [Bradyrhizobium sp.]|uniref:hypothetical protein n=1 Tax=Bradyrhizobium sp. TaxID=376 RepID=UPI0039E68924
MERYWCHPQTGCARRRRACFPDPDEKCGASGRPGEQFAKQPAPGEDPALAPACPVDLRDPQPHVSAQSLEAALAPRIHHGHAIDKLVELGLVQFEAFPAAFAQKIHCGLSHLEGKGRERNKTLETQKNLSTGLL